MERDRDGERTRERTREELRDRGRERNRKRENERIKDKQCPHMHNNSLQTPPIYDSNTPHNHPQWFYDKRFTWSIILK